MQHKKPNVILIMTDQQQATMSAREGFGVDTTPFLDGLARAGAWFDKAYTTCPLCSPARVSLLTGRYASSHRVVRNPAPDESADFPDPWLVPAQDVLYKKDLLDVFRENGYTTAMIGKNHAHPDNKKFDYVRSMHHQKSYYNRSENEAEFENWLASLGKTFSIGMEACPFPLKCQFPFRAVDTSIQWIENNASKPFFLWLSFPEPHSPYQVPEPYYSMFAEDRYMEPMTKRDDLSRAKDERWIMLSELHDYAQRLVPYGKDELLSRARSNYMGMLRLIDHQVERLVRYLREKTLLENTLLVFVSDHGDFAGEFGLTRKGFWLAEDLIRIPLLFVGPGIIPSDKPKEAYVSIADIMPTLCDALSLSAPDGVQGRSLWPMISGGVSSDADFTSVYCEVGTGGRFYRRADLERDRNAFFRKSYNELNAFSMAGITRSVVQNGWKLIYNMDGEGEMYCISEDPRELLNLYHDVRHTEKRSRLQEELLRWCLRIQDPLPLRDRAR